MSDERDRLGLGYRTFFAEIEVPPPAGDRMGYRVIVTETGRGRFGEVTMNLQLRLKAGEELETAGQKAVLGEGRLEIGPDKLGGLIRHRGWTLSFDPQARLVWPVLPFNPYQNGPEKEMRHAVGVLSIPLKVKPPGVDALGWRRSEISFTLEADGAGEK